MANRIVQAVYDLQDKITGKLKSIGDALRGHKAASDATSSGIEKNNARLSQSYAKTADGIGGLKNAIIALGSVVGLAKVKDGIETVIETGERLDDLSKEFANVFGGLDKGAAALDQVKTIAAGVPQGFEDIAAAAIRLRKAGFDPLDGTLQSLLDNQNAVNQSQADLLATIDALGKANVRGEVSMRSFVSLTEAGIPVFDLLGKAMGLSEDRVRALAESGQLGKDSIRLLIDELGKLRAGAGADELGDTDAQIQKLKDSAVQFLNTISNAGALNFFRQELKNLNAEVAAAAADGRLASIAKSISDSIVGTAQAIKATIGFIYNYSGALVLLAKAYAFVKVQSFLDGLASIAAGTTKATGTVRALSTAILAIPAVRLVVLGGTAIVLASDNLRKLGEALGDNLPATVALRQRTAELTAEIIKGAERFRQAAEAESKYQDTQILGAATAAKLSAAERDAQADRYDGLQRLLKLQITYYQQLKNADALNADGLRFLGELKDRLAGVQDGYDALDKAARQAADALDNKLTAGAAALTKGLGGIADSSKVASSGISALIGDFDKLDFIEIGDIALALQSIGEQSEGAAERVRDGLGASLAKLSSADLQRFQLAATAAFDEVGRSGDETAVIMDTTLHVALDRLKVDASKTGAEFTKAGQEIVTAFQVVAENSQATAQEIEAAFNAALGGVKTRQEAEALGGALQAAMQAGRIGAEETEAAMRRLQDRISAIKADTDPLADSFSALGIKSKAALDAAADAARTAFNAIVEGARNGKAAQEDVAAAFVAYAEAVRATAANSSVAAKEQIENQLALQAAALGLVGILKTTGDAGEDAGKKTAKAFDEAKESAEDAGAAIADAGDAAADAGKSQDGYTRSLEGTATAMAGIVAIGPEQAAAMKLLNERLAQSADLTNLSLNEAKYLLSTLGPLAGGAAALIERRINDLTAAAQKATDAANRMADEAAQLQDQIDELEGNDAAVEDRRHQRKLADLAAEAQANGTQNSEAYRKLVELENKLHALKMRNLRDEGKGGSPGAGRGGGTGAEGGRGRPGESAPAPTPDNPPTPAPQAAPAPALPQQPIVFAPNIMLLTGDAKAREELARALKPEFERIAKRSR